MTAPVTHSLIHKADKSIFCRHHHTNPAWCAPLRPLEEFLRKSNHPKPVT